MKVTSERQSLWRKRDYFEEEDKNKYRLDSPLEQDRFRRFPIVVNLSTFRSETPIDWGIALRWIKKVGRNKHGFENS